MNTKKENTKLSMQQLNLLFNNKLQFSNLLWIEAFNEKILKEEFDIPNELTPVCLFPLGYRTVDCQINPLHNKRKNIENIVEYKQ